MMVNENHLRKKKASMQTLHDRGGVGDGIGNIAQGCKYQHKMSTKKHTRDRSKIDDKISDFFTDFEVIVWLVDIWLLVDGKILHYRLSF